MTRLRMFFKYGWVNFARLLALRILRVPKVSIRLPDGRGPVTLCNGSMDYRLFSDIFLYENYRMTLHGEPIYIMDCGANIGLSTRYFMARYPGAQVAAIEPDRRNFEQLEKNIQGGNVSTFQVALYSKRTQLQLVSNNLSSYARRFNEAGQGSESISAVPLQDIFEKLKWPRIDLLKIDIEGAELELFNVDDPWLNRVNVFVMELHEDFKPGLTQSVLAKIFSTGKYRVSFQKEYVIAEKERWIS